MSLRRTHLSDPADIEVTEIGGGGGTGTTEIGPTFGSRTDGLSNKTESGVEAVSMDLETRLDSEASIDNLDIDLETRLDCEASVENVDMDLETRLDSASNISTVTFTIDPIIASKDIWIPNVALCPDDANKDGTDITINSVVATRSDALFGWDLSDIDFSGTTTVTSAQLIYHVKTAPTAADPPVLGHITNGNETWNEATVSCSSNPAQTTFQTLTNADTTTGSHTITLNATARTRINSRFGVGNYSIGMIGGAGMVGNFILQSKDSGGTPGNSSGPRLELTVEINN